MTASSPRVALVARQAATDIIKYSEDLGDGNKATTVLEPYLDPVGIATLGYGHVLYDAKGKRISALTHGGRANALREAGEATKRLYGRPHLVDEAEANELLMLDIRDFDDGIEPFISRRPEQCQFDAMVSLSFNIGIHNFKGSTVLKRHNARNMTMSELPLADLARRSKNKAAISSGTEAFTAWSFSQKKWYLGLFRRRVAENLIYSGVEAQEAILRAWAFDD